MGNKELRRQELLSFIRRRSGCRFLVSMLSKEFGVSERTIQSDLAYLESEKQIKRQPSYNALHRQKSTQSFIRVHASGNLAKRMIDRRATYLNSLGVKGI